RRGRSAGGSPVAARVDIRERSGPRATGQGSGGFPVSGHSGRARTPGGAAPGGGPPAGPTGNRTARELRVAGRPSPLWGDGGRARYASRAGRGVGGETRGGRRRAARGGRGAASAESFPWSGAARAADGDYAPPTPGFPWGLALGRDGGPRPDPDGARRVAGDRD